MSADSVANAVDRGVRPLSDTLRFKTLKGLAERSPTDAHTKAWAWLQELQASSEHYRLAWLFSQGSAPESPDGDCEGIVMNLYGASWLVAVDRLVRVGQWLGGIGWTGKTFDRVAGTGYNRLSPSVRWAALLVMPTYSFRSVRGELTGFPFYHGLEASPLPPHSVVRAIAYDAPEHANPLVLPRTRDEIVEIVPGIYLGRALVRNAHDWQVVGYFGLRDPKGGTGYGH